MSERTTEMEADLRSRVVNLEHATASHSQRLSAIEAWRTQRDIDSARHDERWKHMDGKIDAVGKKVDKISSDINRIVWAVILGIIGAIMAFLIKGGFAA